MKKRKVKKLPRLAKKKKSLFSSYRWFFLIATGMLVLVFVGEKVVSSLQSNILGTTTYIAKGGNDSGSSGSGSSGSGSSRSSSSDNSGADSDDDDSNSGGSGGDSSGSSSGLSGSSGSSNTTVTSQSTASTESKDDNDEQDGRTGVRTKTETKQNETRTEVRLSEEERIRTRTKDGRTRIDITSGGIKVRLEQRDDRVIIKAEQEDGTETELEDDTLLKIEERLGKDGIKVATAGADSFVIQRGAAGAVTNFPLSIDLATNTLTVNTPSGTKSVAVLPDQAVQNLIAAKVVSRIGGEAIVNEAQNNNLSSISQLVMLGERAGVPIYEINGIADEKLLGFIPVEIQKNVVVSVDTGEVVEINKSFVPTILDVFSF